MISGFGGGRGGEREGGPVRWILLVLSYVGASGCPGGGQHKGEIVDARSAICVFLNKSAIAPPSRPDQKPGFYRYCPMATEI